MKRGEREERRKERIERGARRGVGGKEDREKRGKDRINKERRAGERRSSRRERRESYHQHICNGLKVSPCHLLLTSYHYPMGK